MSKHRLLVAPLSLLLGTGCFTSAGTMKEDMKQDLHEGGSIEVPSCSYTVTTQYGASIPENGSPMSGDDPTPWAIHLGITGPPSTSMVVTWRTKDEKTLLSTVQYGVGTATDKTFEGFTFVYDLPTGDPVRIHEAHLCGLMADTAYSYRVGGKDAAGKETWSPVYQFRTAPDPSKRDTVETVVAVLGDTRDGYATWGATLKQADLLASPDLILFNGDAVTLGTLQSEWDEWFRQAEDVLHRVPLISAHGNHDVNAVNYYSQLAMPGAEDHFGLDYGPIHLTVANDTPQMMPDIDGVQAQFLDSDFKASASAPWKILMHHRPLWSAAAAHGGDMHLQTVWGPIIDAAKIDLVLNGHDHDYERSKPMRGSNPQPTPAMGTVYVVAGTAGAFLYENGSGFWTEVSEKTYCLVILRARTGMLDLKAHRPDGTVIDQLTIAK